MPGPLMIGAGVIGALGAADALSPGAARFVPTDGTEDETTDRRAKAPRYEIDPETGAVKERATVASDGRRA